MKEGWVVKGGGILQLLRIVSVEGWLIIFTGVLAVSTIGLWATTVRNTRLAKTAFTLQFYLKFIDRVEKATGIGIEIKDEWRIMRRRIMNKTFQYGEFMEVMEKLFPDYVRKFERVFEIDEPSLMKELAGD